jgi:predicted nucleotidyltransferase
VYIDPESDLCGVNAVKLRDAVRRLPDDWTVDWLGVRLGLSQPATNSVIAAMMEHGFAEATGRMDDGKPEYRNTIAGNALANASAAPPVRRETAERAVVDLLNRVQHVNRDGHFLYKVDRIRVFGSYLGSAQRLNDVDLVVEISAKLDDWQEMKRLTTLRVKEAEAAGRTFAHYLDEWGWPETEVWLYLKARSRTLALHTPDDGILDLVETVQLFP